MKPKCVVTLELPEDITALLGAHYDLVEWSGRDRGDVEGLSAVLADAEGLLCTLSTPITEELIAHSSALKVISTISVGVDHIDLVAATAHGVAVGHTPGVLVDSTADLALALMLAVTRRIAEADHWIRAGHWQEGWQSDLLLGTDLSQSTVGIVGLGPIGMAVAQRLKAFGSRVVAWNRTPKVIDGVEMVDLETLFAVSDVVTLHTALTVETRHIANQARLASMRDGAVIINTGRGPLVDEEALIAELTTGRLRAGLDVFQQEPLPSRHPLLSLPNAVLLPHVGSATRSTRLAMVQRALDNLHAGVADEPVPYCANPEVYGVRQ